MATMTKEQTEEVVTRVLGEALARGWRLDERWGLVDAEGAHVDGSFDLTAVAWWLGLLPAAVQAAGRCDCETCDDGLSLLVSCQVPQVAAPLAAAA
jgi:hypothetical protein